MHPILIALTAFWLAITPTNLFAQPAGKHIQLTSTDPLAPNQDLKQLDTYWEGVQLVGMGESTHGTHEFFTMRHRIFKYLVESHSFNTFFLEAGYANCLRANAYIHGATDNVLEVTGEIGLWPWQTEEMADLIDWMRAYNQANPNQELNFVGIDLQGYLTTLDKVEELFERHHLPAIDTNLYEQLSYTEFWTLKDKEKLANQKAMVASIQAVDIGSFQEQHKEEYTLHVRTLTQCLEMVKRRKDYYYRDIKMAENIVEYLKNNPETKGFFWAHNGHINIQEIHANKFGTKKWKGAAGGVLKHHIGEKYFCLGQDFDEGAFNAYFPDKNSDLNIEGSQYTLGPVTVPLSPPESFAANHRQLPSPVFIDFKHLPKDEYVKMNRIGAAYYPPKDPNKPSRVFRLNTHGRKSFDAMILIKKSTPTRLIKKKQG